MQALTYKRILVSVIATLLMFVCSSFAIAKPAPLPIDEAFNLIVDTTNPTTIYARWQIAPGYYLYKDRLSISMTPSDLLSKVELPQGEFKSDPNSGRREVFTGTLIVPIQLSDPIDSAQLTLKYQGCSSGGFCYPPITKILAIGLPIVKQDASSSSLSAFATDQAGVSALFGHHNLIVTLLIFAGIGLLLAFTPCVLPMIPILTSIILGQHGRNTRTAFFLSLSYVIGASLTYALAGLLAAEMGSSLQVALQKPWIITLVSLFFVVLAFSLFGFYHLRMPNIVQNKLHQISNKQRAGTYLGVFIMGVVSTLIVSPCVTAPLVGVLLYIGQTGDKLLGASALFMMGLGMGVPLLLIGVSAGKWLPKSGPWMIAIKEMFGIMLLGMSIWLMSRILPLVVTKLLWTSLIASALTYIVIGLIRSKRLHRKWAYTLGVSAGLVSLVLIAGTMQDLLHSKQNQPMASNFIVVHTIDDLKKQLQQAQKEKQPVLLDFYADWCESCVLMDKAVFEKPNVQQALQKFKLIRADLTANDSNDELIMQKYSIVAPPTVLFFNENGDEKSVHRIVGEVDVKEFLKRLTTFEMASCNNKINC